MGKMRRNIGVFEKFVDAIETEWYNKGTNVQT